MSSDSFSVDSAEKSSARKRWLLALANMTLVLLLFGVYTQPGITALDVVLVGAVSAVLVNGAAWFGFRQAKMRSKKGSARLCLLIGGLSSCAGIIEFFLHDSASATQFLSGGLILIAFGALLLRKKPGDEHLPG